MRTTRLVLVAFVVGALLAAAPVATALAACSSMISDSSMACYLVGEDDKHCYYQCYPNTY